MNKKIYVSMTDKYLSGWGGSKNKINKYVVECDNREQADQIEMAAHRRPEMKYVNINKNKPYYNPREYMVTLEHYNDLGTIWTDGKYRTDNEEDEEI